MAVARVPCWPPNAPLAIVRRDLQALLVQNNILLLLIYHYQRRPLGRTLTLLALLAASAWVAASGVLSDAQVSAAYDCNNAILILSRRVGRGRERGRAAQDRRAGCGLAARTSHPGAARQRLATGLHAFDSPSPCPSAPRVSSRRVPQILANFRARGTGQLSLITYGLNTAGAAARIFTSVQEQAGAAMLRGAVISERQGGEGRGEARQGRCGAATSGAGSTGIPPRRPAPRAPLTRASAAPPAAGTLLNAVLALQIVFYGGGSKSKAGKRGKKKTT